MDETPDHEVSIAEVGDPAGADEAARKPSRRRLAWGAGAIGVLAAAGIGTFVYRQVEPVVSSRKYAKIEYSVPVAPKLTPAPGETVYRVDPTQSSLTYEIDERFAGRKTSTATGVTNGIAGDIAINAEDLSTSRIGELVINVEQFHSDNNLRDARLRQDFLESNKHPLATVKVDRIDGLEGKLVEGQEEDFTVGGTLTVKGITAPATFEATASLQDDELHATATTTIALSRFKAGPINIAGLVTTADEVRLTLELVALDPSDRTIPTTITGPDAKEPDTKGAPSFAKDIQPILENNCVSCHATGEMGSRHIKLDTAKQAADISDGLKTVTQTRYMPPWPASDVGVELEHVTRLSDEEIAVIARWADAGGPLDVAPDTTLTAPPPPAAISPRADQQLTRPAYTGSLDNTNDYRCFVMELDLDEPMFLTGYEFTPDVVEQLHHVQVFHISEEQRENARKKDGEDGRPGWSCYSGPSLRGQRPNGVPGRTKDNDAGFSGQANLIAGWVPGQLPVVYPENAGIYLKPGDAMVLQLHYHYGYGEPEPDQSSMSIQLDPVTPDRKGVRVVNPIGPVEIPCMPEDQDQPLCDRDTAIEDNVRLYGPSGANNELGLLGICNKDWKELASRFADGVATSECSTKVPEDGTVIGVLGHMHTIGKSFRLTLAPGTPEEKILLDIPEWSFDWQMNYGLAEPLKVKAGQELLIECAWDRGKDPTRKPKYIVFAEGTEDEMCFGTYSLIPDDQ